MSKQISDPSCTSSASQNARRRNRRLMHVAVGAALAIGPSSTLLAQLSLTGQSYLQDFNGISAGLPTGWTARTAATSSATGSSQAFNTSQVTWGTATGQFANYASATGLASDASTTLQNGSTDRAFGIRQTAAFANPGAAFTLQIGDTAGRTGFSLAFDAMMLSVQARSTTWTIQYGVGLNPTSFTDLDTYSDPSTFGPTHFSFDSSQLSGFENQSQNVWFRVVALAGSTGSGNNDTFGIDNFSLSWTGTGPVLPVPQYWDLNGNAGGIGGAGPSTWDTGSSNWTPLADGTGAPAIFNSGSVTVFGGTSSTVSVAGGGVTANAGVRFISDGYVIAAGGGSVTLGTDPTITVTNSTDTATINAGLSGTSGLIKAGAGTLVLGGANNFTGGTTVSAGTLKISDDSALGDSSGALTLNGGTLVLGASVTTARAVPIVAASTIDTAGFDLTISGPLTNGGLTKLGTGKLTLQAAGGGTGVTSINAGTVRIENATALGAGAVSITNGSLELAGVSLSTPTISVTLNNNAELFASGSSSYSTSGSPAIGSGAVVTLAAPTLSDTLQIGSGVTGTSTSSVINVTGSGTVFLASGLGPTNGTGFRGLWNVAMDSTGVLRLGNSNAFGAFSSSYASATVVGGTVVVGGLSTGTPPQTIAVQVSTPMTFNGGTIGIFMDGAQSSGFTGALTFSPSASVSVDTNDFTDHATGQIIQFGSDLLKPSSITWGAGSTVSFTGAGTVNISRSTTYTVGGSNTFSNGVTVGAGATVTVAPTTTVNLGGALDAFANNTQGAYVNIANSGTFNLVSGAGAKNIGNLTGSGTTTIADNTSLTAGRFVQSTVALNGSGSAAVRKTAMNNTALSVVGTLSLGNGSLDLNNNDLVITGTDSSTLDTVKSLINNAANHGAFDQTNGITSSVAKAINAVTDPAPLNHTGLGYAVASSVGLSNVDSTPVDGSSVVVKYTLIGDANLDGVVNALDFNALAINFGQSGDWSHGDFTYDNTVDTNDFMELAKNFLAPLPAPPASPALGSLVPEPMALGLLGLAALGLPRRRRA